MGEQPWWVADDKMLSPPLAFSANLGKLVDEQLEKDLGKLVDEQLGQQVVVVGNTRLCLRLAANLTRGTAPTKNNVNNPQC